MSTFIGNIPAVGAAGTFDVPGGSAITGGNGSHGTAVTTGTTGKWVIGTSLAGRALGVFHQTTTIGSSVTELKAYLYQADDANGTNAAAVSGAVITWTVGTPTANAIYAGELPTNSANVSATKYYGVAVTWKASAGTNNTGTGGTVSVLLDPVYVPTTPTST